MPDGSAATRRPARGHRIRDATSSLVLEAWAPTRIGCLEEAVAGAVETFAAAGDAPVTRTVPVAHDVPVDEDLLVQLLEDVVALVHVLGVVPVGVALEDTEDGGVAGDFEVVPVAAVVASGLPPRAVSHEGVEFGCAQGCWTCRAALAR